MIAVRVTCNNCSEDVEVMSWELHLTIFTHGIGHYYEFLCKACLLPSKNYASENVVRVLVANQAAEIEIVRVPQEYLEPKPDASPLTLDDLIDLHNELESL